MSLPTPAQVRSLLPALAGTGEDEILTTLIARADAALAAWCGFPSATAGGSPTLEATSYTEYLDGPSELQDRALLLPVRPVTAVTTIHDDVDGDWTYGSADLVSSSDYVVDGRAGRVWLKPTATHGAWSRAPRAIKVVFTAGFDCGAVHPITEAISALVAHWLTLRRTGSKQAVTQGGQSQTLRDETIPERVRELMWPYRMLEVGCG